MERNQVEARIKQMISFIEQEANEKAREIEIQADEEFTIEKQRRVEEAKQRIRDEFSRKEKQFGVKKRIALSSGIQQSRLSVLQAREDLVQDVSNNAATCLSSLPHDSPEYRSIMTRLIVQGLHRLDSKEVGIVVCKEDEGLAKGLLREAEELFSSVSDGVKVTLSVSGDRFLDKKKVFGGCLLTALLGRIKVDNTLAQRLDLCFRQNLPVVRDVLFGQ